MPEEILAALLKKHPNEVWFQPRYYQSDGSVKGHEFGLSLPAAEKGELLAFLRSL